MYGTVCKEINYCIKLLAVRNLVGKYPQSMGKPLFQTSVSQNYIFCEMYRVNISMIGNKQLTDRFTDISDHYLLNYYTRPILQKKLL